MADHIEAGKFEEESLKQLKGENKVVKKMAKLLARYDAIFAEYAS